MTWFSCLEQNKYCWNVFIITRFKHCQDGLNNVAPGSEFFSPKCAQFSLPFTEWNYNIIHFRDKPFQEIDFKRYLNSWLLCT